MTNGDNFTLQIKNFLTNNINYLVVVLVCLVYVCTIGLTEFNTKGEPREAVVAMSMINQDDWILPTNNGGDIPYKPPFFHWCIALFSVLFGGFSEAVSRLPSVMSFCIMLLFTVFFYLKKTGNDVTLTTILIMATTFELNRAGGNCRVDMMLTMAMVGSLYSLFEWIKKGGFVWAVLSWILLSVATLTKGPVGVCLPLFCMGVHMLIRGEKLLSILCKLLPLFFASLVFPALWYYAAWQRGGDEFLQLVYDENFGRLTGTMSYVSHEGPAIINVVYLLGGFMPWTVFLLIALVKWIVSRKKNKVADAEREKKDFKSWIKNLWTSIKCMDDYRLYTLLCGVLIVLFFCIPTSKRSVYLMPAYPFISYFIAELIEKKKREGDSSVSIFSHIMFGLICLLVVVHLSVKIGFVPESVFIGRHANQNIAMLRAIEEMNILSVLLPVAFFVFLFFAYCKHSESYKSDKVAKPYYFLSIMTFYIMLMFGYMPAVLNTKSLKWFAKEIEAVVPAGDVYSFMPDDVHGNPDPLHYFEIDYYLGDRVKLFVKEKPKNGYLIVQEKHIEEYPDVFSGIEMDEVLKTDREYGSFKNHIYLMRFSTK